MAAKRCDPALLRETLALVTAHGGNVTEAARAANLPRGTLLSRYSEARRRRAELDLPEPAPPPDPVARSDYDAEWRTWQHAVGASQDRYLGACRRAPRADGRTKILVVPDLHAPFHERDMVAQMIEAEADADLVLLMGDIGDSYSLSRFLKFERVDYETELAAVQVVLEAFSAAFPRVLILTGNHDGPRLEKQLRERLAPDFIAAILAMTGGTLNPIEVLCRRYPNVELATHNARGRRMDWLHQRGDAVFLHAEKFSRVPGSALRGIEEWLADMEHHIDLAPWRVVFQAHTHQLSWFPFHADKLLVEVGCLCQQHGYQLTAKIGGRPQRRGYVTLEQVDGVTDINSVRLVWLDRVLPDAGDAA